MHKKSHKNPKNKSKNNTEQPQVSQLVTEGLVIQRDCYKEILAIKEFRNLDARKILEAADERNLELVIMAGKFSATRGCYGVIGNDSIAYIAIAAANGRMTELGSSGTVWAVLGNPDFVNKYADHLRSFGNAVELNWRNLH